MKAKDLREKSVDELKSELKALLREQFNLRMQKGGGQPPKSHLHKKVKLDIARVNFLLADKEKGARA